MMELTEVKELRATMRLRNNRLLTLREQLGLSQAAFAEYAGVSLRHVQAIEAFNTGCYEVRMDLLVPTIERIAARCGIHPDTLAPPGLFEQITCTTIDRELGLDMLPELVGEMPLALPDPDRVILAHEIVARYLPRLRPRQQLVVRKRLFAEWGFKEIGACLGLTTSRAQQIFQTAMSKLQELVTEDERERGL